MRRIAETPRAQAVKSLLKGLAETVMARRTHAVSPQIFDTYDQALAQCGEGYEDARLVDTVARKTCLAVVTQRDLQWLDGAPVFLGLTTVRAAQPNQSVRLLDFGGACGFHVRVAKRTFPDIPLRATVVETAAMARASSVRTELSDPDIRVLHSLDAALNWLGGVDLVQCSGAIQYVPNPDATLRSLAALGAPFMLFQRMHFAMKDRFIRIQTSRLAENGPGPLPPDITDVIIAFPCTHITEAEFLAGCTGYTVQVKISSNDRLKIEGRETVFGDVFLLKRGKP